MSGLFRSFLKDARGVSALIFGLAAPAIALAVGGGIDFSQAAARRQRIASAMEIGCRAASLEINFQSRQTGADPKKDYTSVANAKIQDSVNGLSQPGVTGLTVTATLANNIITAVATAASANAFGGILGYDTVALRVERNCNYVVGTPGTPTATGKVLFVESFETGHNVASNSWTVLKNWNGWTTQSSQGGIEINGIPELAANTIRFGNFFAELDSHCYTSGCKTNSSMWREFGTSPQLEPGDYELSYWYISRVRNAAYAGKTLCALKTDPKAKWDDLVNANWEGYTNRIEVFFQQKKSGAYTTPAINNNNAADLVDVCVHTDKWTERKIPLKVTTKGTYRIFFQAAGREDTYGGLIDYIRFCSGSCP
ncbi:TadE/TadG family type IV pilus assembly protein [Bosea sp. (in: a-proteobacteria)]|jgi:Flp pilus assembly protein TadG|uniref:TadE/TadG family type IV pilus assembly protein n=1 Tax=Bosea sp. (in: a-proteobacteria) TaxID=1871050 RepID=UPI002DDD0B85|nr:TadE/TadG family type IV pilus assembly protein [Bosea sp. (in: a-proteobacteria)]HEV2509247.1 TadE/TadG family type IV pilus assembly protein [Bosea sp. (in: a-proteobacteria)]